MKTIVYFFLIIFSFSYAPARNNDILFRAAGKVTTADMNKAASIIRDRMKSCRLDFEVRVTGDLLRITVPEGRDTAGLGQLVTARGNIGIYATFTPGNSVDGRITCEPAASSGTFEKVSESMERSFTNYRLAWSVRNSEGLFCLYALKTDASGNAFITGGDVEIAAPGKENDGSYNISLRFKIIAAEKWEHLTSENIGRPLAIVIDDKVVYAPVVRDVMKGGVCEITGTFSRNEAERIAAIIGFGPLPVSFSR